MVAVVTMSHYSNRTLTNMEGFQAQYQHLPLILKVIPLLHMRGPKSWTSDFVFGIISESTYIKHPDIHFFKNQFTFSESPKFYSNA